MTGRYQCPKCGNGTFRTSEMRAAGGFLTKMFDFLVER